MVWLTLLFGLLAGFGKAMRDTIAHHWGKSRFSRVKNAKLRKWLKSDENDRPSHKVWFLWDGWHFGDSASYFFGLLEMAALTLWKPHVFYVVLWLVLFAVGFNLFYKRLLVVKNAP